jgi:signal transduction histidine kinase/ligand-binding sensor domain-containing protein/AraC-like DNA-binding protein
MSKTKLYLLFSILLVSGISARGQETLLLPDKGILSGATIYDICQDSRGNILITTEKGLNIYDGSKCTLFEEWTKADGTNAIPAIIAAEHDAKGRTYLGRTDGLSHFDHLTKKAHEVVCTSVTGEPMDVYVKDLIADDKGRIWVATLGHGVFLIDEDEDLAIQTGRGKAIDFFVNVFVIDTKGNIFIGTERNGIQRGRIAEGRDIEWTQVKGTERMKIDALALSPDGDFLAANDKGLYRISHDNGVNETLKAGVEIKKLLIDSRGKLLIGTHGQGLQQCNFNPDNSVHDISPLGSTEMYRTRVWAIFEDNAGNLWIGLQGSGVARIPSMNKPFQSFKIPHTGNVPPLKNVSALGLGPNGEIYAGTDGLGLYRFGANRVLERYYGIEDGYDLPYNITTIKTDSTGALWIGGTQSKLGKFDPASGKVIYTTAIDNTMVTDFVPFDKNSLFVSTLGGGLYHIDLEGRLLRHVSGRNADEYTPEVNTLNNRWINGLSLSASNLIYINTCYGLGCFDLNAKSFVTRFGTNRILAGLSVITTCEDKEGNLWIGTTNGLYYMPAGSDQLTKYDTSSGLPDNSISGLCFDNRGDLWITTAEGLARWNSSTGAFSAYYAEDGLNGNEFLAKSILVTPEGWIYAGGPEGVTCFYPEAIDSLPPSVPSVRIVDFYLNGQPVTVETMSGSKPVIEISDNGYLYHLAAVDNSFGIEFSTALPGTGQGYRYFYSLDNSNWNALPLGASKVNFSELSSGHHKIWIRAGRITPQSVACLVQVYIRPFWYATTWAIILWIVICISVIYAIVYFSTRIHRLRIAQMQQKQRQEINETKLQFLLNMAHEIRTPMSLISSPVKSLMASDKDQARQRQYNLINRNTERLLQLVNQLMDLEKLDRGRMLLSFQKENLVDYIRKQAALFEDQIAERGIRFGFHTDPEVIEGYIDTGNFDKVIVNLMSNALKYTPNDGEIKLNIASNGKQIRIELTDNGPAIPVEEQKRIFEQFYRISSPENRNVGGTGIGLHLTRSLVHLHYGEIGVRNITPDMGTCFTITLPTAAYFPAEALAEGVTSGDTGKQDVEGDTGDIGISSGQDSIGKKGRAGETESMKDEAGQGLVPGIGGAAKQGDNSSDGSGAGAGLAGDISESGWLDKTGPGSGTPKTSYSILIVDDNADIRSYLHDELGSEYHIEESANGREALEKISRSRPDLIISDVMMPVMDGITLCKKIKQNIDLNDIPVILLTALTREEDTLTGIDSGADWYLTKPFNLEIMRYTIANLLRSRKTLRNRYLNRQLPEDQFQDIEISTPDEKFIERVMKYINLHIADPDYSVEMLAADVGVSRVHLNRKLKEMTNQTSRDFIRNVRLHMAAELLRSKDIPVTELATAVGMPNISTFSAAFREQFGVSPTKFRAHESRN